MEKVICKWENWTLGDLCCFSCRVKVLVALCLMPNYEDKPTQAKSILYKWQTKASSTQVFCHFLPFIRKESAGFAECRCEF